MRDVRLEHNLITQITMSRIYSRCVLLFSGWNLTICTVTNNNLTPPLDFDIIQEMAGVAYLGVVVVSFGGEWGYWPISLAYMCGLKFKSVLIKEREMTTTED